MEDLPDDFWHEIVSRITAASDLAACRATNHSLRRAVSDSAKEVVFSPNERRFTLEQIYGLKGWGCGGITRCVFSCVRERPMYSYDLHAFRSILGDIRSSLEDVSIILERVLFKDMVHYDVLSDPLVSVNTVVVSLGFRIYWTEGLAARVRELKASKRVSRVELGLACIEDLEEVNAVWGDIVDDIRVYYLRMSP